MIQTPRTQYHSCQGPGRNAGTRRGQCHPVMAGQGGRSGRWSGVGVPLVPPLRPALLRETTQTGKAVTGPGGTHSIFWKTRIILQFSTKTFPSLNTEATLLGACPPNRGRPCFGKPQNANSWFAGRTSPAAPLQPAAAWHGFRV